MILNFWSFLWFAILSGSKEKNNVCKKYKNVVKMVIQENECLFSLVVWEKCPRSLHYTLLIVAPCAVKFGIPCNIPSLHLSGVLSSTLPPLLLLPSILGIPFLSFHLCGFHILQALYRPDRSLPSIASDIYNCLLTHTLISSSVSMTRFVSNRFLVHWVALKVCLPRRRVVVVHLTVNL